MKKLLWLGFFFQTISLLFFVPVFTTIDIPLGFFFLVVGLCVTIIALRKTSPLIFDNNYILCVLPLLVLLFFIPFPLSISNIILACAILLHRIAHQKPAYEQLYRFATALTLAGCILFIQSVAINILVVFMAHTHHIDLLSPAVSFFLNVFGIPSSVNAGMLYVQSTHTVVPFTITLEKLGFYPWILFSLAVLCCIVLFTEKRRLIPAVLIYLWNSVVYLFLRLIFLILVYMYTQDLSIFWDPFITLITFLPFPLLCLATEPLVGRQFQRDTFQQRYISFKKRMPFLLFFISVFCGITVLLFQIPGPAKHGRILIDEYHSDWEDSVNKLNTTWYGQLSTYNYYSWVQYLSYHYHVHRNIDSLLTSELLNTTDILVLKCPTQPYDDEEIQAVHTFIRNGGGVFLIGDHTDVFGMNTFLNQIAEPLGLRFNSDALYDLKTGELTTYIPPRIAPHPLVAHISAFDFMTSCSLEPTSLVSSLSIENVMIGTRLISEPGTYSTENFFRKSFASSDSNYGCFLQCAAIRYGKGRVVAFTDSTVFSSFCVFTDGYLSFSLSVFEYLNTTNMYGFIQPMFLVFSLFCFCAAVYLMRREAAIKIFCFLVFSAILTLSILLPISAVYVTSIYAPTTPNTQLPLIIFDQEYSAGTIILKPTPSLYTDPNNYGTLYVWTQRLGYIPYVSQSLEQSVHRGDVLVLINPNRSFDGNIRHTIEEYLHNGGVLMILDSIKNQHSTTNELINSYGLWLKTTSSTITTNNPVSNESINQTIGKTVQPMLSVSGGEAVLTSESNTTICSQVVVTNTETNKSGRLIVFVDSYSFSDASMGGPFSEPTEFQENLYQTMYYLFGTHLGRIPS